MSFNYLLKILLIMLPISSFLFGYILFSMYLTSPPRTQLLEAQTQAHIESEIFAVLPEEPVCQNCVYISKGKKTNKQSNPILDLNIYSQGQLVASFEALSGRTYTQNLDRNIAGNKSPAPSGLYTIESQLPSNLYETGGVFLAIEPSFKTNRSNLGIHVDPSWGLTNGEDGTSGCIAVKSHAEYSQFINLLSTYKINSLIINYD